MAANSLRALKRLPDGTCNPITTDAEGLRAALADSKGQGLLWIDLFITSPEDAWPLSDVFGFHPLTIEDCVSPRVDPAKIDDYGDYIFIVVQALTEYVENTELEAAEVDFYLGANYVVCCRQVEVPALENYRSRLERGERVPGNSPEWLLHGLLDALVDEYLPIVDAVDDTIDNVELQMLEHARPGLLQQILTVKRNALRLRRATTPQRDIMNRLARNEFPQLVHAETSIYFRDIYDHLVRIEYLVEGLRDLADGALQTYLSVVSNRLNEVMKVLTATATVFLPLTVITGVYGMNFEENQFPSFGAGWGFAAVVIFMFLNSVLMLSFFRYRRWI
ncbi:MAG: magnesium/cobalt transporter CorA [Dehalococcoidia bacterium]